MDMTGYVVVGAGTVFLSVLGWMRYRGLEYVVKNYRWVFVCIFLLPLSVVYDSFMYFRTWLIFRLHSAPHKHAAKVKQVQDQVCMLFIIIQANEFSLGIDQ